MKNFISKYNAIRNEQLNRMLAKSVNFGYTNHPISAENLNKSVSEGAKNPDISPKPIIKANSEMYRH